MTAFLIGLGVGLVVGVSLGTLVASLLFAARDDLANDDEFSREFVERERGSWREP